MSGSRSKWFAFAATVQLATILVPTAFLPVSSAAQEELALAILTLPFAAIPVVMGVAMLKYRLYDIVVVINKAIFLAALAAFITVVYVAVVVGVGTLVGRRDEPNLALSVAAAAIVAVIFQPVRARVQRFANRLLYGERATPYEVLSAFSARMGETAPPEELLGRWPNLCRRAGGHPGPGAATGRLRAPAGRHMAYGGGAGRLPSAGTRRGVADLCLGRPRLVRHPPR
ncbi:MAG: hypothetical protein M3378_02640 [Actinomycetota bacterium]|nr:hypothetical protein [Actinomycetota bacterium]